MPVVLSTDTLALLKDKATMMRIHSVRATDAAGSGHPTTCASAAEIMSALFFSVMRYDPKRPADRANDNFILSKGHAAPVLYAAWCEAGYIPAAELLTLRKIDSDLEGHPPVTLPFVDVATGSLGQGLSVGLGMALAARLDGTPQRTYVLMGDGEIAEGSVWESVEVASHDGLDNLCATVDVNRLGQSAPTLLQHDMRRHKARWTAFGWHAIVVDGHDVEALVAAYAEAAATKGKPTVILAKTLKGKGLPGENQNGFHGKPVASGEVEQTLKNLEGKLSGSKTAWKPNLPAKSAKAKPSKAKKMAAPPYKLGDSVATRKAFGQALAALAKADSRVVAVDADVKNSTYTENLEEVDSKRFFEGYIAEQNMVGMAMGLGCRGKIPFASTFACFFTRAADFVRMAAISHTNVKLVGTHAGISIGEDGPSQMGLEDLAMTSTQPNYTVLYPSEAMSAWRAIEAAAAIDGPCYVRTSRPNTPTLYGPDEAFGPGVAKVVKKSKNDRVTVVGAGVTLFEALKAHSELAKQGIAIRVVDLFSIRPVDKKTLVACARATGGNVVTVEDHYAVGGVGDAVLGALAEEGNIKLKKLAVRRIARSGQPDELLEKYGISANHIVKAVKSLL
jgi:transketolase